jgi:hypothetical protein
VVSRVVVSRVVVSRVVVSRKGGWGWTKRGFDGVAQWRQVRKDRCEGGLGK